MRRYRNKPSNLTNSAITRLARRGGVKRISGMVYETVRGIMKIFVENVLRDAITTTEYAKRKTVTAMDVVYALKRQGRTMYGYEDFERQSQTRVRNSRRVKTEEKEIEEKVPISQSQTPETKEEKVVPSTPFFFKQFGDKRQRVAILKQWAKIMIQKLGKGAVQPSNKDDMAATMYRRLAADYCGAKSEEDAANLSLFAKTIQSLKKTDGAVLVYKELSKRGDKNKNGIFAVLDFTHVHIMESKSLRAQGRKQYYVYIDVMCKSANYRLRQKFLTMVEDAATEAIQIVTGKQHFAYTIQISPLTYGNYTYYKRMGYSNNSGDPPGYSSDKKMQSVIFKEGVLMYKYIKYLRV